MNKPIIPLVIIAVVAVGIGAYFIFQKPSILQSLTPSEQSSNTPSVNVPTNIKPLFGTMIAFNINEAAMSTPGTIDALQKGWTEFRKNSSAYQNLKSNLKNLFKIV